MLDRRAARELGAQDVPPGLHLDDAHARELPAGWFFPYRATDPDNPPIGANGVIVNKQTGSLFHLGSAFPIERDLALYDRGYQFDLYEADH